MTDGSDIHMNLVHHGFLQFESDRPIRSAGQAKQSAGLSARAPDSGARDADKKKACRVDHPAGFYCLKDGPPGTQGPGSSTRATPRRTRTALRRQQVRRRQVLVRRSCPHLQLSRRKNKKPGGLGLPGLVKLRRPSLRGKGSRKAIQRNMCAAHPPLHCGSSMRLA